MDFSALNPNTSNALNLAARENDVVNLKRLLKKINPNCVDNRGWTCLHEAAANDSYDCLLAILRHKDCIPLSKTHEGHTALYLACRSNSSMDTIMALLIAVKDIATYGSLEGVTPLHLVCGLGRTEAIQPLLNFGAMINAQDVDGDTPLHDAALKIRVEAMEVLLHAGAYPDIRNGSGFTPFHLACCGGCLKAVEVLFPFVTDINFKSEKADSPLVLATRTGHANIAKFLLDKGADPHTKSGTRQSPLEISLTVGNSELFKILFKATDRLSISHSIISLACRPHLFTLEIIEHLLESNLGREFFLKCERIFPDSEHRQFVLLHKCAPTYEYILPLGCYLGICEYVYNISVQKFREFFYLFLMRGLSVNASDVRECPALVHIHYKPHIACFEDVFQILIDHGCYVDYCSMKDCKHLEDCIPDAFIASLNMDPTTLPLMLPYSLNCEPDTIFKMCLRLGIYDRIPFEVSSQLMSMIDPYTTSEETDTFHHYVPCLKHLCRLSIRKILRNNHIISSTEDFLLALDKIPLPFILKDYLHYT